MLALGGVLSRVAAALPRIAGVTVKALPQAPVHLFISPEGGISVFTETHYRLARILAAKGHNVAGVWCHGLFPRCPVKQMRRLPFDQDSLLRRAVCLHCCSTNDAMARGFAISLIDLRHWPTATHLATATAAVDSFDGRPLDFSFDNIGFGKLAAMDLVLATKRCNLAEPSLEAEAAWRVFMKNCLFSFLLFNDVFRSIQVASVVVFNDYSMMLAARLAAERQGIPALTIEQAPHLNSDNRRVVVRRDIANRDYQAHLASWPTVRAVPLTPNQIDDVCDDIVGRLEATGSHTFSPPKTFAQMGLKERLGFPAHCKLIVAYTSSLDELLAQRMTTAGAGRAPVQERHAFDSQVDWLLFLTNFCAQRADLRLAIRVHPREGAGGPAAKAGKVHRVESEHLQLLRKAFPQDPAHTRIFWPDDPMSSYDLAEMADVATVSFSTIGLELARLGVPVVACVEGVGAYVADDFTPISHTPPDFEADLVHALETPISAETWRLAMRFAWHAFLGQAIDLRSLIDADGQLIPDEQLRIDPGCDEVEEVFALPTSGEKPEPFRVRRPATAENAFEHETEALAAAAGRLLSFLGYGPDTATGCTAGVPESPPMIARLQRYHRELHAASEQRLRAQSSELEHSAASCRDAMP
jgi:hypothetical protein